MYFLKTQIDQFHQQALSYGEIKALCTGDERIKEKLMLDNEVKELKTMVAEHNNTVYEMQDKITAFPEKEQKLIQLLENLNKDRELVKKLPIDPETKLPTFKITIGETEYTDRKEGAKAFETSAIRLHEQVGKPYLVGEFQGFKLSVKKNHEDLGGGMSAILEGSATHTIKLTQNFAHNLKKLESRLYSIDQKINDVNTELEKLRLDFKEAQSIVNAPFPQAEELEIKQEKLQALTDELNQIAMQEKLNAPKREKTNYFEQAQAKKQLLEETKKAKNSGCISTADLKSIAQKISAKKPEPQQNADLNADKAM